MHDILIRSLSTKPEKADLCGRVIAQFLESMPEGCVDLYGCGAFANALVKDEKNVLLLRKLNVRFIQTVPGEQVDFHGFPVISLGTAIKNPALRILLLSYAYEREMLNNLQGYRGQIIRIREALRQVELSPIMEEITQSVKKMKPEICVRLSDVFDCNPVIIFVTNDLGLHTFKFMRQIRKLGYTLILFTEFDYKAKGISIDNYRKNHYFDYVYKSSLFFPLELLALIDIAKPKLIHAEVGMWNPGPLASVMERTDVPVSIEYRDVFEAVFKSKEQALTYTQLTPEEYDCDMRNRKTIYRRSAGFIYKESNEIVDFLSNLPGYEKKKHIQYLPYLSCEHVQLSKDVVGKKGIVSAASLCLDPTHHAYPLHRSLLEAGITVASQGLHFTVYNASDSTGIGYEEFVDEDRKNPFFHYKFAVPYDQLVSEMKEYQYAFFCFNYKIGVENKIYTKTTFGSRVFAYLEAGLPIIVSPEIEWMAKIITDMNFGITCSFQELHNLKSKLKAVDRASMVKNIAQKQTEWSHEKHIHKLKNFYDEICDQHRI